MFDIDGTLIESCDLDSTCFVAAVKDVLGVTISSDWGRYRHVTDAGILRQVVDEVGAGREFEEIELSVKERFISHIQAHLSRNAVLPTAGAVEFLAELSNREDIALALATGGWPESAKLKLDAAGIYFPEIPIASCSDHYSRIEIMKAAERKVGYSRYESKTYFGDGAWDLEASLNLGYNFVLVGSRILYRQSINSFREVERALTFAGLEAGIVTLR